MAGKKKVSSWMGDDSPYDTDVPFADGSADDGGDDSEWVDQQTVTVTGPQDEVQEYDYTTVEEIPLKKRHWLHRLLVPQDDTSVDTYQGYPGYQGYSGGYPGYPQAPRQPGRPGAPGRPQAPHSPYRPGTPSRPGAPRPPSSYRPPVTGRPGGVRPQAPRAGVRPPGVHQGASRTTIQGEDDLEVETVHTNPHADPHGDASGLRITFGCDFGAVEATSGGDPVRSADKARVFQDQKGSTGAVGTNATVPLSQAIANFFSDW